MYYCKKCNNLSKSGAALNKVVTEIRKVEYVNKTKTGELLYTKGTEIVEEIGVCIDCLNKRGTHENKV